MVQHLHDVLFLSFFLFRLQGRSVETYMIVAEYILEADSVKASSTWVHSLSRRQLVCRQAFSRLMQNPSSRVGMDMEAPMPLELTIVDAST